MSACSKYKRVNPWTERENCHFVNQENSNIIVYDSAYTDPAAFKAAMQGVKLIAERAEYVTEPLTVPKSYIQAEPGGSLRFAQPDGTMPVPHAIQYPVNRREALNA